MLILFIYFDLQQIQKLWPLIQLIHFFQDFYSDNMYKFIETYKKL